MALPNLLLKQCFGYRPDIHCSLQFLEEGLLAYPAGHIIVLYNLDTKLQRFLQCSAETGSVTALALAPNRKYLAVAESASPTAKDSRGCITVYDLQTLKRRKLLIGSDTTCSEYVYIAFSPDSRLLLAQAGGPDWTLALWTWDKAKLSSLLKVGLPGAVILSCLFCPNDSGIVSVISSSSVRIYRTSDGVIKAGPQPLTKREQQDYTCQAWIIDSERERLLVGCQSGEILLMDGLDLKAAMHTDSHAPCNTIAQWSKGFVTGQGNGTVSTFERIEGGDGFQCKRTFKVGPTQALVSMVLSPQESTLALGLASGQIYTLHIGSVDLLKPEEDNFELLGGMSHCLSALALEVPRHPHNPGFASYMKSGAGMELPSAAVAGMDVCVRKPIVATSSLDKALRIWNWQDGTLELCKFFQDEAYSVALHPNGLSMLVGFADKLRLMSILMDDFKVYQEFPIKACREVRFSHGGHLFAVANGTLVQLYKTYTCEPVGTARGHSGKVEALCWSLDDTCLVSAGRDGAMYEWQVPGLKRNKEHVLKGCQYMAVAVLSDGNGVLAAGSDKMLKYLEDQNSAGTQIQSEIDAGETLTCVEFASGSKTVLTGGHSGRLRTYKYPLTPASFELHCHNAPITRMRLSEDESILFTAGDDGALFIFDVRMDVKATGARRDVERLPYAEEVMVTKAELDERKARYHELDTKLHEQLRQNQVTIHIKDLETRDKIKQLTEKFSAEAESEHQRYDFLQQQKVEAELEYNDRLQTEEVTYLQEKKQLQLAALDSQYQAKIMAEVERYQTLLREKEVLNQKWDEQNAALVEAHERVVQEITEELEARLLDEQLHSSQETQAREEKEREFAEVRKQLEEDADREIETLKERYEARLLVEKKLAVSLKGENGLMRKRFTGLEKSIDEQKAEIRRLHEAQDTLYATIATHEKDINAFKEEIKERDSTISEKEKRIYDLKKKNQELEKFKFVLDHKIKELKRQIEPNEEEIADMKQQIRDMDEELQQYHKANAALDRTIDEQRSKMEGLRAQVLRQRADLSSSQRGTDQLRHDIHDLAQSIQNAKELKEKVKLLYERNITAPVQHLDRDEDVQLEYQRQRDYLERTVKSLKNKLDKDAQLHRTDNMRIMQENVALLKEINELRREIKQLRAASALGSAAGAGMARAANVSNNSSTELTAALEKVSKLQFEIANCRAQIAALEAQVLPRPVSRERLPEIN